MCPEQANWGMWDPRSMDGWCSVWAVGLGVRPCQVFGTPSTPGGYPEWETSAPVVFETAAILARSPVVWFTFT